MLTGQPAPGAEPDLVDEIGTYVDVFNPDPFTGLVAGTRHPRRNARPVSRLTG